MHYDLAIAGAGPVGSVLAMLLARSGFRVLVAERSDFGKPRIGETAPPELRSLLAQLGLAHVLNETTHLEAPSVVSVWGSDRAVERPHILSPFGAGIHLDRRAFDRALADAAHGSGAELRLRTAVRFRKRGAGGYDVISRDGVIALANHVVLAAGQTGLCGGRVHLDDQIAIAARIEGLRQPAEQRTIIEAVPGGWVYCAALPLNRLIAAFMTRAEAVPSDRESRHRLWIDALSRTKLIRLALAAWPCADALSVHDARASCARHSAGADWCAIGDARLAPDPLSGQGVLWAIQDAMRVARLLVAGWSARSIEDSEAWHRLDLDEYRGARAETYAMERRFPTDAYWNSRQEARGRAGARADARKGA